MRNSRVLLSSIVAMTFFVGCEANGVDEQVVAVDHNDLGVAEVHVRHLTVNDDRLLEVVGVDKYDAEVGRLTLRTGTVMYSMEPGVDEAVPAEGSELYIAVGETNVNLLSPDRFPHREMVPNQVLETFARLPAVEAATNSELGITFGKPERSPEAAYTISSQCSSANFPTSKGGNSQCCWNSYSPGNGGWALHRTPAGDGLALRGMYYACKNSNGTTCTAGASCWYGPCGGHVYPINSPNNSNATAYIGCRQDGTGSCTGPETCYGDSNGSTTGGGYEGTPDPAGPATGCNIGYPCTLILFAGSSVSATCPYTGCDSNGNPF